MNSKVKKYSPEASPICILGSTGSIGTQTLEIVRLNPNKFRVASLSTNSSVELLREQIIEFEPDVAVIANEAAAAKVDWDSLEVKTQILIGPEALTEIASSESIQIVVVAIVGFAALEPSLAAIRAGKDLAQANKEMLVAAGNLVKAETKLSGSLLCPVDSEHNSLFQCVLGRGQGPSLRKMTLTASGGPFYTWSKEELRSVTPEQAVKHPNWDMGAKNSIDSASLMN
ncbi:UNVERIFIED_CONTAM: hypothetical protein GTU68_046164, partial [Idotea baltica]|nr:hypothetical protein [Idotea baltica]